MCYYICMTFCPKILKSGTLLFTFFVACICMSVFSAAASAFDIVVLQDAQTEAYNNAYDGFLQTGVESHANGSIKSIRTDLVTRIVLRQNDFHDIESRINALRPDLIVAIGEQSLSAAEQFSTIPVVSLLALNSSQSLARHPNISGISMHIPASQQLADLIELIPAVKRIGIIYDPAKSRSIIDEATLFAEARGITLVTEQVRSAREVSRTLSGMAGKIDAFWMLPDTTVITTQTIDAIFLFSFQQRVPVLTFADKFIAQGAVVAVTLDLKAIGMQAGEMARSVLAGNVSGRGFQEPVRKSKVRFNDLVAQKMYLRVNTAQLKSRSLSRRTR